MTAARTFALDAAQAKYLATNFTLPADVARMLDAQGRSQVTLTHDQRDALVELVGDRLQRRGFDGDWKPTEDGRMMESIIDALTKP